MALLAGRTVNGDTRFDIELGEAVSRERICRHWSSPHVQRHFRSRARSQPCGIRLRVSVGAVGRTRPQGIATVATGCPTVHSRWSRDSRRDGESSESPERIVHALRDRLTADCEDAHLRGPTVTVTIAHDAGAVDTCGTNPGNQAVSIRSERAYDTRRTGASMASRAT